MKRIAMTLVFITVLSALCGCGNRRTQNAVNEGEQDYYMIESEISETIPLTEPNTTNDGIDNGKIKRSTETTVVDKVIPQWDIKNDTDMSHMFYGCNKNIIPIKFIKYS